MILFKNQVLRRLLLLRLAEVVLIVGLIVGLSFMYSFVEELQQKVHAQQQVIEEEPLEVIRQSSLRSELRAREHDISRITAITPPASELGQFVSELEASASSFGVVVQVPEVKEESARDAAGKPIEGAGPLTEARVTVVAFGTPLNLLRFLYSMEHGPFLAKAVVWHLQAAPTSVPGFTTNVPATGTAVQEQAAPRGQPGLLNAEFIVSLTRDE